VTFETFLALRYLKGARRDLGGSLTSVIAVASVAVGVAALVVTLAVMTGAREDIRAKILGAQPHLLVQPIGEAGLPAVDYSDRFAGVKDVKAWAPYVLGQALARSGRGAQGVVVKGVDPDREPGVTGLDGRLRAGRWDDLRRADKDPAVFLGKELAQNLGVLQGDRLVMAVSLADTGAFGGVPAFHAFVVAGVVETGLYDYDNSLAVVSLAAAQRLFRLGDRVSGPRGSGLRDADEFAAPAAVAPGAVRVRWAWSAPGWGSTSRCSPLLRLEKIVMFLILTLITLVAAFTILSNLLLVTAQRTREIGILRAMGATRASIRRIFLRKGSSWAVSARAWGWAWGWGSRFC
jgi:lipoprotein-releasing system permease protein